MAARSFWHGNRMVFDPAQDCWVYEEDGVPIVEDRERNCGHCRLPPTKEGHDGCLGTLPGVMNACCGHGGRKDAYIQYPDRSTVRGEEALEAIEGLKKRREAERK